METKKGMRNIWYFVGLILSAIGLLVLAAGVYDLLYPTSQNVRLADLHTNIWWGALIFVAGMFSAVKNKDGFVDG